MTDRTDTDGKGLESKKVNIADLLKARDMSRETDRVMRPNYAKAAMFSRVTCPPNPVAAVNNDTAGNDVGHDDTDGAIFSRVSNTDLVRTIQNADTDIRVCDEADRAMFTRVDSDIFDLDTNTVEAHEDRIVPLSYKPVSAEPEPPVTFYGNTSDLHKAESVDDIDTGSPHVTDGSYIGDPRYRESHRPAGPTDGSGDQSISSTGHAPPALPAPPAPPAPFFSRIDIPSWHDGMETELPIFESSVTMASCQPIDGPSNTEGRNDSNGSLSSDETSNPNGETDTLLNGTPLKNEPRIITQSGTDVQLPVPIIKNQLVDTNGKYNTHNDSFTNNAANESADETGKLIDNNLPKDEPKFAIQSAIGVRKSPKSLDGNTSKSSTMRSQMTEVDIQMATIPAEDEVTEFRPRYLLGCIIPCISLVIFLADIGTDIELAVSYRRKGDIGLFYITLACIIFPSIIMAVVDLSWLWLDEEKQMGPKFKVLRIVLGVLSFGRIVRAVQFMYHTVRKKTGPNKKLHHQRAIGHKRDCYMMDFINAFVESCPQLFVQIYLLYKYDLPMVFVRVFSLLTSWISIAWTYASYYRTHREALSGRQDVNIFGFILFFLSVLSTIAARVICVSLFLVYCEPWIGAPVLTVHFLAMLAWIMYQKPVLKGTTNTAVGRFMYKLLFAYVSMICFVNMKDTKARFRMSAFYLIVYVENFVISGIVIWRILSEDTYSEKAFNFIALPIGMVLHVSFLLLYYKCLHPKIGLYYKSRNESAK